MSIAIEWEDIEVLVEANGFEPLRALFKVLYAENGTTLNCIDDDEKRSLLASFVNAPLKSVLIPQKDCHGMTVTIGERKCSVTSILCRHLAWDSGEWEIRISVHENYDFFFRHTIDTSRLRAAMPIGEPTMGEYFWGDRPRQLYLSECELLRERGDS